MYRTNSNETVVILSLCVRPPIAPAESSSKLTNVPKAKVSLHRSVSVFLDSQFLEAVNEKIGLVASIIR